MTYRPPLLGRQKGHAFPSNSTSFKVKLRLELSEKYSIDGGIAVIKSFLQSLEKRHEDNRRNLNNTFLHSAFSHSALRGFTEMLTFMMLMRTMLNFAENGKQGKERKEAFAKGEKGSNEGRGSQSWRDWSG